MSSFFLRHKDLFEYDKYVGRGPIIASTPSFLEQYRESERQQAVTVVQNALMGLEATLVPPPFFALPDFVDSHSLDHASNPLRFVDFRSTHSEATTTCANTHPYPPVSGQSGSPDRRMCENPPTTNLHDPSYAYQSKELVLASPKRGNAPRITPRGVIPKLNDLLIDSSTRAIALGPSKRLDDTKKIELLIGSKCVGRISAAASSNLPLAIRHRLEASSMIHQRRERLYQLLKEEYTCLTS